MTKSCSLKGQQKLFFLHLNQVASCCRAHPVDIVDPKIDHYIDLWNHESQQLDQGIELPGCKSCWNAEQTGQLSYRQLSAGKNQNYVEIYISNLCNQMCSYCSPKFSSVWENNIQTTGNFVNVSQTAKENLAVTSLHTDRDDWIDELKGFLERGPVSVKLLGGEPLMQKHNLQKLLDLDADNIVSLNIHTNLNPPSNKFLKWVLNKFSKDKLFFTISLDTIPTYNSVPRAGFDSEKFLKNLDLLKQYDIKFSFLSVISILNIFSIKEYLSWINDHGYNTKFQHINNPDCLDPFYMPAQFKALINHELLPDQIQNILTNQPSSSLVDLKLFEQYNYLKQYFQRTNTTITDPKLENYWNWLKEQYK